MIERSLYNWMTTVHPGVTVVQAPFEGPRPASPYLTYQIISVVPEADRYKSTLNGAKDTVTHFGTATMRVSVNAYAQGGYDLLNKLHQSKRDINSRLALLSDSEDLTLIGQSGVNTLTALGDESWRSRFQSDFNFLVGIKSDWTFERIQQFNLTGEWVREDENQTISITTIAPETPLP